MGESPIRIVAARMSVEETRALIACLERAIGAYCLELQREALNYGVSA
jgi:hypothetical protein